MHMVGMVTIQNFRFSPRILAWVCAVSLQIWPSIGYPESRFRIDVRQFIDFKTLPEEAYVLYTHPTTDFDVTERARPGVEALNQWSRKRGIQQILLYGPHATSEKTYYLSSDQVDLTVESTSGFHKLKFPNAKHAILAGGILSQCFCQSLRDLLRGSAQSPLKISLVMDATYSNYDAIKSEVMNATPPKKALEFISKKLSNRGVFSIEELRQLVTTDTFLAFIKESLFQEKDLCNNQGREGIDLDKMKLQIKLGGQSLTLGKGNREVVLDLVRSKDLPINQNAEPADELYSDEANHDSAL
jgi:hypothetical protein